MRNIIAAAFVAFGAPLAAEPVTIAALGDSLTQGFGLPEAQGFVPQMEAWLIEAGAEVELINAGVSGDTTQGGLSRVGWTLTPDVDAMIVTLGGNDLLRGIDPALSRANIEGILQAASEAQVAVLLVGMQAPGNYGPEYKDAFDGLYPELAERYGAVFYDSFFAVFADQGDVPAQLGEFIQPDGIHPSAKGVEAIVGHMGPSVLELIETLD
ncbi:MAG: arylesterase [Rhodobacteraceae bacterium]|nr:arylesterase [Paracoccaceae bacterium]